MNKEYIGAIRFDGNSKKYFFSTDDDSYKYGDRVLVRLKSGDLEEVNFVEYAPILGKMPPCPIIKKLG